MSGYVRVKSAFRCKSHTNKVSCRNACNGNPANQSNLVKGIEKLSRSQMKPSLNIHSKQLLIWASYCHECGEHSNLQVYWCWPTTGQAWLPLPEFRCPPVSDQQPSQMKPEDVYIGLQAARHRSVGSVLHRMSPFLSLQKGLGWRFHQLHQPHLLGRLLWHSLLVAWPPDHVTYIGNELDWHLNYREIAWE